jgi:hypothetical protein
MHGNELRKSGQSDALDVLEHALTTATPSPGRGGALALLARAAASAGDAARFTAAITGCHDLIQRHGPAGPLSCPFTVREIQLRGLLDLGNPTAAIALAQTTPPGPAPAPQWEIIERITFACVLLTAGDHDQAETLLHAATTDAGQRRLPHQIQRIIRITRRHGYQDLHHHARSVLAQECSRPVLDSNSA